MKTRYYRWNTRPYTPFVRLCRGKQTAIYGSKQEDRLHENDKYILDERLALGASYAGFTRVSREQWRAHLRKRKRRT